MNVAEAHARYGVAKFVQAWPTRLAASWVLQWSKLHKYWSQHHRITTTKSLNYGIPFNQVIKLNGDCQCNRGL